MTVYIDLVVLLNFLVDFLLLLGTNRLCGYPPGYRRSAIAGVIGGIYGGLCLHPGFAFLANIFWLILSFLLICIIAFGWGLSALRRGVVFLLLSMALGGIAIGLGEANAVSLIIAAACVCGMCIIGFQLKPGTGAYVPIELIYRGKRIRFYALYDTGNTLRDPITGATVLVVGSNIATDLVGFTKEQLAHPVKTIEQTQMPGLRLLPYRSIGNSDGLLLALRLQDVTIGKWHGSSLVAFAPVELSADGTYQALTGGAA